MPKKRIYILNGHPAAKSLSKSFADLYARAAERAGHEVRLTHLDALDFDMDFERAGYGDPKPLEPDLEQVMDDIRWCEHLVIFTPMWWGSLPAKFKGLIDRAFLPGNSFDPRHPNKFGVPAPMLTGRSARVVLTSDSPTWYLWLAHRNPVASMLKGHILGFVGIKPVRVTQLAPASHAKPDLVARWSRKIEALGAGAA
ncbi:NAD(P)H-dependent oxidoreductase [Celeribacter neptunius]|uniref:Putative NADPH-quinone reductase (Modulator of drug activity B) n=1 Tax=Celeribacter neptunius TaxID=588602 RepID=A0A1I3M1Q4_9RHOB|nr:NAD(P)H-dependent oxidoreductase [Celeribacter neptunius]SFI90932.1 Putative NADPH-quinone reductase (modulator of drug activity B) [Celeribacter neptunius]